MSERNKTHNWQLVEPERGLFMWKCTDCKIDDDDPLAHKKCMKFNALVHLVRKIIQIRKDMFHSVGMFILRFSR